MRRFLIYFLFLLTQLGYGQLTFSDQNPDLGVIPEAYEIKGDVIIKNESEKKIFLLRADADKGIKVFASKKTLLPKDTCLLIISFIPDSKGKFRKGVKLVASDKDKPYELSISGNLNNVKQDDKTACFYFGSRQNSNVKIKDGVMNVPETHEPRDVTNKMPNNASEPVVTKTLEATPKKKPEPVDMGKLPLLEYKPNNIVFLIDVSNSMKDSAKLPLMKKAMYALIDAVRDVDKITLLTYSDSVKIIKEGVSGSEKQQLKEIVSGLKAHGLTKGNKAILRSQSIAQRNYIAEGNNQVIMATDGKFRFYSEDQKKWNEAQGNKKIILTTVAFGDDKDAMKNLKEIAEIGEGSFIHMKKNSSDEKLLEEIKTRSKR
ncbi:MAG: VWA domain-containing protein [Bacteroidetes bacterium]|nr:VWA domain-containing protein [Bacteroidota bacterium]